MDLTPGERAVLGQIRVLYSTAARRDQPIKALTLQWTPMHYQAYKKAYAGLVAKQLIEDADAQLFRITDAGLEAIGVAAARPQPQVRRMDDRPLQQVHSGDAHKQRVRPARSGVRSALSRLVIGLLGPRT
jgi:hypothetical protein